MDVKLTLLFLTISSVLTLSHLTRPTGVEAYVLARLRHRQLAARRSYALDHRQSVDDDSRAS